MWLLVPALFLAKDMISKPSVEKKGKVKIYIKKLVLPQ